MFCRWLFVLFLLALCCLSFSDLRILIAPLVSPNSSFFVVLSSLYENLYYILKGRYMLLKSRRDHIRPLTKPEG